jgi:hypothetical protein
MIDLTSNKSDHLVESIGIISDEDKLEQDFQNTVRGTCMDRGKFTPVRFDVYILLKLCKLRN